MLATFALEVVEALAFIVSGAVLLAARRVIVDAMAEMHSTYMPQIRHQRLIHYWLITIVGGILVMVGIFDLL